MGLRDNKHEATPDNLKSHVSTPPLLPSRLRLKTPSITTGSRTLPYGTQREVTTTLNLKWTSI